MKKIVYTRPEDGGISIVSPASKTDLEKVLGSLTQEAYEAYVIERSIPEGALNVRYIEEELPADREFRDAWRIKEGKIVEDVELSKQIKLKSIIEKDAKQIEVVNELINHASLQGDEVTMNELKLMKEALLNPALNHSTIKTMDDVRDIENRIPKVTLNRQQTMDKIDMRVQQAKKDLEFRNTKLDAREKEFQDVLSAINGFMMIIPEMQKTLLDIQKSLPNNKETTK